MTAWIDMVALTQTWMKFLYSDHNHICYIDSCQARYKCKRSRAPTLNIVPKHTSPIEMFIIGQIIKKKSIEPCRPSIDMFGRHRKGNQSTSPWHAQHLQKKKDVQTNLKRCIKETEKKKPTERVQKNVFLRERGDSWIYSSIRWSSGLNKKCNVTNLEIKQLTSYAMLRWLITKRSINF